MVLARTDGVLSGELDRTARSGLASERTDKSEGFLWRECHGAKLLEGGGVPLNLIWIIEVQNVGVSWAAEAINHEGTGHPRVLPHLQGEDLQRQRGQAYCLRKETEL